MRTIEEILDILDQEIIDGSQRLTDEEYQTAYEHLYDRWTWDTGSKADELRFKRAEYQHKNVSRFIFTSSAISSSYATCAALTSSQPAAKPKKNITQKLVTIFNK